jgi:hypothetical protein
MKKNEGEKCRLTLASNEDKEREHAREPRPHPRENWDAGADLSAVQHVPPDEGGFRLAARPKSTHSSQQRAAIPASAHQNRVRAHPHSLSLIGPN